MKRASPNQQKHSAAIREGVEKVKERLEEADGKIQVLEDLLQAARDGAAAARAETKLAQEAARAAMKRAEEAMRESKEKDARIAAVKRRLNFNSRNSQQPPLKDWPATPRNRQGESLRTSNDRKTGGQPGHRGHIYSL